MLTKLFFRRMSVCCVSGCNNRYSPSSSIKFYRIPAGSRPYDSQRRRLWVAALEAANGRGGVELQAHARVCGAHFISGEASMDNDSPDFVPSVFTSTKEKQNPKKRMKRSYASRKRRHHRANAATWKKTPAANLPADLQSSVLMEVQEMEKLSHSSELKEGEISCKEALTETETVQSQTSNIQNVTPPSAKEPASIQKMNPFVLLKPLITSAGGYRCEVCIETFIDISGLVKHKQIHEEQAPFVSGQTDLAEPPTVPTDEPSFPCNMCDRSFTTTQNLKRHKLLHVKDGRKCLKCGVLFCRRHNHVLFQPQPESMIVSEEDSFTDEEQRLDNESQEKNVSDQLEPTQIMKTLNNAQTAQTPPQITAVIVPPLPPIPELLPKASPLTSWTRVSSLALNFSKNAGVSRQQKSSVADDPPAFVQPHLPQQPKLPPSMKLFSPHYLTSALLEVKRNYDYILNKTETIKINSVVKGERDESVLIFPLGETIKQVKREKIAYDLEVIL